MNRILIVWFVLIIGIATAKVVYQKKHAQYQKFQPISLKAPHSKLAKVTMYSKQTYVPVKVPAYEFGYKIHDPFHKNFQEKTETRTGDAVQGYYSLLQPNGEVRVVRYQSDDSGFHSKVTLHKKKPTDHFSSLQF